MKLHRFNCFMVHICLIMGITITSGFYQLWRSSGIITQSQLKYACAACLIATHSGICIRHTSCYTSQCISNLNLQTSIATTRSIFLAQVAAHHFTTGVVFIILGIIRFFTSQLSILTSYIDYHAELSINLATTDYSTVLCLLYPVKSNLCPPIPTPYKYRAPARYRDLR